MILTLCSMLQALCFILYLWTSRFPPGPLGISRRSRRSWAHGVFHFPLDTRLIPIYFCTQKVSSYHLTYKVCDAGETPENMVYGTEIRSNFSKKAPQIRESLEAIERHEPGAFLFSGGRNNIAGPGLETFLDY
jgi:hypothetical protein